MPRKAKTNETILIELLIKIESEYVCDYLCGCDFCEDNCKGYPQADCYKHYCKWIGREEQSELGKDI